MKLKIGKRGFVASLVILIGLIAYNVIYFVIPFNRDHSNASFWITYGITTFLMLFMGVVVFLGIGSKTLKSRIFGVPILYLGISVMIAQLIVDALVMGIGNFVDFKYWIVIIIETLLLAFFFISLIARTAYKDTIEKIDASEVKQSFIKELRVNAEVLVGLCKDAEFSKKLNKLYETVKYTDPVSDPSVEEVEDRINDSFSLLRDAVNASNYDEASVKLDEINSLLNERKLRLKSQR